MWPSSHSKYLSLLYSPFSLQRCEMVKCPREEVSEMNDTGTRTQCEVTADFLMIPQEKKDHLLPHRSRPQVTKTTESESHRQGATIVVQVLSS